MPDRAHSEFNWQRKRERKKVCELWSNGQDGRETCTEAETIAINILNIHLKRKNKEILKKVIN